MAKLDNADPSPSAPVSLSQMAEYCRERAESKGRSEPGHPCAALETRGGSAENAGRSVTAEAAIQGSSVNDKMLSRAFAEEYGGIIRYVPEQGAFYCYDGEKWMLEKQEARPSMMMKQFTDELFAKSSGIPDEGKQADFRKSLAKYSGYNQRSNALNDAKSELVQRLDSFDAREMAVNVANGTLDLETFKLYPHSPDDMLTRICKAGYDECADCAEWEAFLSETFGGDSEKIGYLQKVAGLAVAGDTSYERMHIAYGKPRSGKSTFLETIAEALGSYAATANPETLAQAKRNAAGASGDLARLAGVRFVVMPEAQKGMLLNVALLKRLTGGDMITARYLYREEFQYRPRFSLWINTNSKPAITDMTAFTGDRICIVSFNRSLDRCERDLGLKTRLKSQRNLDAVLLWAVRGLDRARKEGAEIPSSCRDDTEEYAEESDKIGGFFETCLEKSEGSAVDGGEAYSLYREYCESNGMLLEGKKSFFGELRERGLLVGQKRLDNVPRHNVVVGYRKRYT